MPNKIDLTGRVFGRLTALHRGENYKLKTTWVCRCECGNIKTINYQNLIVGGSTSCGCFHNEMLSKKMTIHGNAKNGRISHEFRIWANIKNRCENENHPRYKSYGGRGIIVCESWSSSFQNFINDMGKIPSEKHSIERVDNDGNYEPSNCKWATIYEQSRNKRSNVWIEYNGIKKITADWATEIGITPQHLRALLRYKPFQEIHLKYKKIEKSYS